MKATDKPQISKKWWATEKPADVKGTELDKALQNAEKALADEKKKSDARSIDACITTLHDVCSAAERTCKKELDKKKHKDQIAVLEKYNDLVKTELKRLEDAKAKLSAAAGEGDEDEDDPSDDKLFDREYLEKSIKRLRKKPMLFAFGLGSRPEDCVLVLKRKGQAKQLFTLIRREKNLRKVTYGTACADDTDNKTMIFELEGAQLPGLMKKGRMFLRAQNLLPFRDLKIIVGGVAVDDLPDDEGSETGDGRATRRQVTPEQKDEARRRFARIEQDLRRMAAERNLRV